jgi:hypothetical protein
MGERLVAFAVENSGRSKVLFVFSREAPRLGFQAMHQYSPLLFQSS